MRTDLFSFRLAIVLKMPAHYGRFSKNRRYNRPYTRKFIPKRRKTRGRAVRTYARRPFIPKTRSMRPGSLGGANKMNTDLTMDILINKVLNLGTSIPQPTEIFKVGLNDLFDPLVVPALLQQATGFDQFAALYNRYLVKSVRITYKLQQKIAEGTEFATIRLLVKPSTVLAPVVGDGTEELSQKGVVTQYVNINGDSTHGSFYYSMAEMFQENPLEDTKGATVSAQPAQTAWWQLVAFNGNAGGVTSLTGNVRLVFDVDFTQRKDVKDVL